VSHTRSLSLSSSCKHQTQRSRGSLFFSPPLCLLICVSSKASIDRTTWDRNLFKLWFSVREIPAEEKISYLSRCQYVSGKGQSPVRMVTKFSSFRGMSGDFV
jgi:hypothetical protein